MWGKVGGCGEESWSVGPEMGNGVQVSSVFPRQHGRGACVCVPSLLPYRHGEEGTSW